MEEFCDLLHLFPAFEALEFFRFVLSVEGRRGYVKDAWNWLDVINLSMMIYSISLLDTSILSDHVPDSQYSRNTGHIFQTP